MSLESQPTAPRSKKIYRTVVHYCILTISAFVATLFDVKIQKGTFLTQTISKTYMKQDQNGIEKCVNFILNGIGSFLGI